MFYIFALKNDLKRNRSVNFQNSWWLLFFLINSSTVWFSANSLSLTSFLIYTLWLIVVRLVIIIILGQPDMQTASSFHHFTRFAVFVLFYRHVLPPLGYSRSFQSKSILASSKLSMHQWWMHLNRHLESENNNFIKVITRTSPIAIPIQCTNYH